MGLAERKFWIFDMDGTLTIPAHDFDAIKRKLGLPPDRPILEQLEDLPAQRAGEIRRRLDEIEREIAREAEPQPGARELLETLSGKGVRLGILTRNNHANALETLERCGLRGFFDPRFVFGRESCDPKPSPDGIRKLLARWKATPGEAVMVGDFLFDLKAGREAGTATVHVDAAGKNEWSEHADITVGDLRELRKLIEAPE